MGLCNNDDEAGGLWDRKTSRGDGRLSVAVRRRVQFGVKSEVLAHLVGKFASAREPSAEGFDETVVALAPFGLCGRKSGVRQSWRTCQPEAYENGQRFIRDGDVPFDPLHLPRHPIETPRQRGLEPVGAVGRQMRGERRLDHQRLRYTLASSIVSELAGEIGGKAKI